MRLGACLLLGVLATDASAQALRLCREDVERGERARGLTLWAQMHEALASAAGAHTEGRETLALHRFDRTLDRDGNVKSETAVDSRQFGTSQFRTAAPELLSRQGFVLFESTGDPPEFRAPDLRFFLSREFTDDHCFEIVEGRAITAGLVGLRFQPVPARQVADVQGTFWADAERSALQYIEFSYRLPTHPQLPRDISGVGGRIEFERLSSGNWIVRDWIVRLPVLTQRGQLLGYREEGGEALVVSRAMLAVIDSIEASRRTPGTVRGIVVDSLRMRGFAGATVWLDSAGPRARTDVTGSFILRGVRPGLHVASFSHPTLDSIGIQPRRMLVRVGSDSTSNVVLGGPTLHTLRGDVCAGYTAIIVGKVRDVVTDAPLDSVEITLSWVEIAFADNRLENIATKEIRVYSDSRGRYAACVPSKPEITGFAQRDPVRTGPVDVRVDDRQLAILHFAIDRSAADTLHGSAVIRGVVKYQDGTPLADATVTLTDPDLPVTSDSAGRFLIGGIPGGTRVLDARALGHAPSRVVADLRPGDTTNLTIYMRKVQQLDPVVVRAAAGDVSMQVFAELEERRRLGQGHRLDQLALLTFKNARMDAVVRALPFVRVRGKNIALAGRRGADCRPNLWVDGQRWSLEDLDMLAATDLIAVEVFTRDTDVPLRYQNFNSCGSIMVWRKAE